MAAGGDNIISVSWIVDTGPAPDVRRTKEFRFASDLQRRSRVGEHPSRKRARSRRNRRTTTPCRAGNERTTDRPTNTAVIFVRTGDTASVTDRVSTQRRPVRAPSLARSNTCPSFRFAFRPFGIRFATPSYPLFVPATGPLVPAALRFAEIQNRVVWTTCGRVAAFRGAVFVRDRMRLSGGAQKRTSPPGPVELIGRSTNCS